MIAEFTAASIFIENEDRWWWTKRCFAEWKNDQFAAGSRSDGPFPFTCH